MKRMPCKGCGKDTKHGLCAACQTNRAHLRGLKVLVMRYQGMRLQQIATVLGVTRERVRQIETWATHRQADACYKPCGLRARFVLEQFGKL